MSPEIMNFALLLSLLCVCLTAGMAVPENILQVVSYSGADCELQCTAKYKPGVQYRAVRWYKVGESPSSRLSGLLTKDLPNGPTSLYSGVKREVMLLDESRDITLPNVTCGDSGLYSCHLAAPVGEQNQDGLVLLTLTDCVDLPKENLMTDTYLVISATVVLMLALVIFLISYGSLKNMIKERNRRTTKEIVLNAPFKPLDKEDLKLIYTLGPKVSKAPTMKHVCV
ncbi:CD83 antigen [Sander lucioperca]|uniref:Ig-like domain-containing protein n=1 Tax=Sander lucioperca TaxID=283035 RepID=A0A8C9Z306_SANLU|nr:CD83 antigen [Sander lucioperca]